MPGVGGREPRVIARRILGEIIEPRMEEIFSMAQRELMRSGVADSLASGLVLVGGTSLLEGTQELAERIFNLPVRRGLPINLKGHARGTDETRCTRPRRACCCTRQVRRVRPVMERYAEGGSDGCARCVSDWVRDFF